MTTASCDGTAVSVSSLLTNSSRVTWATISLNNPTKTTRLGVERLLDEKLGIIRGQRIGLVCNQASVLPNLRHVADVFAERAEFKLTTYFGPQHGIRGDVQDNMIETEHSTDPRTGLPVYSLYSETREPTE